LKDPIYKPVQHDHEAFLKKAGKRKGFKAAYDELEAEYHLASELCAARMRAGLTQEAVAAAMGTTKSAVSRLEASVRHSPSMTTLTRFAEAVGCRLEITLVPIADGNSKTAGMVKDGKARKVNSKK
jgi:DNA-binding XRE family transcriptional regulator